MKIVQKIEFRSEPPQLNRFPHGETGLRSVHWRLQLPALCWKRRCTHPTAAAALLTKAATAVGRDLLLKYSVYGICQACDKRHCLIELRTEFFYHSAAATSYSGSREWVASTSELGTAGA